MDIAVIPRQKPATVVLIDKLPGAGCVIMTLLVAQQQLKVLHPGRTLKVPTHTCARTIVIYNPNKKNVVERIMTVLIVDNKIFVKALTDSRSG